MSDAGLDYEVVRLEQEFEIQRHANTIAAGEARLAEIERQIVMNNAQTELNNRKLRAEAKSIERNNDSLTGKIGEIRKNLDSMVEPEG